MDDKDLMGLVRELIQKVDFSNSQINKVDMDVLMLDKKIEDLSKSVNLLNQQTSMHTADIVNIKDNIRRVEEKGQKELDAIWVEFRAVRTEMVVCKGNSEHKCDIIKTDMITLVDSKIREGTRGVKVWALAGFWGAFVAVGGMVMGVVSLMLRGVK